MGPCKLQMRGRFCLVPNSYQYRRRDGRGIALREWHVLQLSQYGRSLGGVRDVGRRDTISPACRELPVDS